MEDIKIVKAVTIAEAILLLIIMSFAIWLGFRQLNQSQTVTREVNFTVCQKNYVTNLALVLHDRAVLSDEDRAAVIALARAEALNAHGSQALQTAVLAYTATEAKITAMRAAHPIPTEPDC